MSNQAFMKTLSKGLKTAPKTTGKFAAKVRKNPTAYLLQKTFGAEAKAMWEKDHV